MPSARLLRDYVIVFGAAVRPDGRPSRTLLHRIEGASAWAKEHPEAMLIATGAIGRFGAAEADVIAEGLRAGGIPGERILVEPCGRDTLESVRLCHRILSVRGDCARIVCATSSFHQPRCALLFRLLGYEVVFAPMPSGRGRTSRRRYAQMVAKEIVATPYDALILLARRAFGRL